MRVAVIGGGASGIIAALTASSGGHQVTLFEKQARIGRKLLTTGNGRCNLSNTNTPVSHLHGDASFIDAVLQSFDVTETLSYFKNLGLLTLEEPTGRIYPYSNMAGSVLDVLRFALEKSSVTVRTSCSVQDIRKTSSAFTVFHEEGQDTFDRVILALGGAAGGKVGGSTDGYTLARKLGHRVTPVYPSLVQVKTDPTYPRALKGIKTQAGVSVLDGQTAIAETCGEILFTEYGVSGPALFDISRNISMSNSPLILCLNFLPMFSPKETLTYVESCRARQSDSSTLLCGSLQSKLGQMVIKSCGLLSRSVSSLQQKDFENIAYTLQHFLLPVTGTLGFDQAQVTAGGINTNEFKKETLESIIVPGLYACGELLDVDGDCGGYNLQWAWSSGHLAGQLR